MQRIDLLQSYNLAIYKDGKCEILKVICCQKAKVDANLRIIHGTELTLKKSSWVVSDREAELALLGRPFLERLGIYERHLFDATCAEYNGFVDVPKLTKSSPENRVREGLKITFTSFLEDLAFHKSGGREEDQVGDANLYSDIGEDPE